MIDMQNNFCSHFKYRRNIKNEIKKEIENDSFISCDCGSYYCDGYCDGYTQYSDAELDDMALAQETYSECMIEKLINNKKIIQFFNEGFFEKIIAGKNYSHTSQSIHFKTNLHDLKEDNTFIYNIFTENNKNDFEIVLNLNFYNLEYTNLKDMTFTINNPFEIFDSYTKIYHRKSINNDYINSSYRNSLLLNFAKFKKGLKYFNQSNIEDIILQQNKRIEIPDYCISPEDKILYLFLERHDLVISGEFELKSLITNSDYLELFKIRTI